MRLLLAFFGAWMVWYGRCLFGDLIERVYRCRGSIKLCASSRLMRMGWQPAFFTSITSIACQWQGMEVKRADDCLQLRWTNGGVMVLVYDTV